MTYFIHGHTDGGEPVTVRVNLEELRRALAGPAVQLMVHTHPCTCRFKPKKARWHWPGCPARYWPYQTKIDQARASAKAFERGGTS